MGYFQMHDLSKVIEKYGDAEMLKGSLNVDLLFSNLNASHAIHTWRCKQPFCDCSLGDYLYDNHANETQIQSTLDHENCIVAM